jgi:hypothetical protein
LDVRPYMKLLSPAISRLARMRLWRIQNWIHQIELFMKYPHDVQDEILKKLLQSARGTEFGKKYDFDSITNYEQFAERVPIASYEDMFPYIERLMRGEQNILWPSEIKWFSKSSGTTNARSKFIPVSTEALQDCHFKGGKDMYFLFM